MFFNKGWFLILCAGFAVLFVAAVVFLSPLKEPKTGDTFLPSGINSGIPATGISGNAFLPNSQPSNFYGQKTPDNNGIYGTAPLRTTNLPIEYRAPSLQAVKDLVAQAIPTSTFSPPHTSSQATVALPSVGDAEITIDRQGASTAMEYTTYFVTHFRDIQFDNRKLDSVAKDGGGLPYLPIALIEKGIQDNSFSGVRDSLLVYREFIEARIAFLKSIKVSGGAVDLDKKTIAFDKLELSLIDKTTATGATPDDNFKSFFAGFKAKALYENQNLLKTFGILAFLQPSNFFSSLLNRFGVPAAFAQTFEDFGGQIGQPIYCSCDAGYLISMGSPKPPESGFLFISVASLSSPLFFPNKSLKAGSWWLGLDLQTSISCQQYAGTTCVDDGEGSLFFMAGTSI